MSQGIFVGVAAAGVEGLDDGVALADGVALDDGVALADGEALVPDVLECDELLGFGLADTPGFGTHPASPSAIVAASATTMMVDRSRESAMVFIVREAP